MTNICGLPLEIAKEKLENAGYTVETVCVASKRSEAYHKNCALRVTFSGNTARLYWSAFPKILSETEEES